MKKHCVVAVLAMMASMVGWALTSTTSYPNLNYIAPTTTSVSNLQFGYQMAKLQSKAPFNVLDSYIDMKVAQNINARNM